ncbi:hypothetical protein [Thermocatellispora tengchongensis]|uniref:hypothetical protein n=1 Tax=Thermocatellispora tengchongensis TaxID=1073253 RepID=UPI0036268AB6
MAVNGTIDATDNDVRSFIGNPDQAIGDRISPLFPVAAPTDHCGATSTEGPMNSSHRHGPGLQIGAVN